MTEQRGYGTVQALLHGLVFSLLATQFVVGCAIDRAAELFDRDRLLDPML